MKKTKKINVLLILCALAPLAACVSCGKVSAILGMTDTSGIILEDKEIFLNLTEKFEWIEYSPQSGDTINIISRKFKISDGSIYFGLFREGEAAKIPSMSGISHKVENGDTVSLLSRKYEVPQEVIMDANNIKNDIIDEDELFIPNPFIIDNFSNSVRLKEHFIYPAQSIITRPFGWQYDSMTDMYSFHPGIDLQVGKGAPVRAAMKGIVYDSGNDPIHGKYVILQHDYNYLTLYSNLSNVSVKNGNYVRQGKIIGEAGNTGTDSEPHLHFGIFKGYNAINLYDLIEENNEYEFDDIEGFIVQTIDNDDGKAIRIVSYMGNNTAVRIPHTIKNLPVKEIGDMAFYERGLTSVTIPDSVTYIGSSAFNTNRLKRLTIPNSVTIIDYMAFAGNNITRITINAGVVLEEKRVHYDFDPIIDYGAFELKFDDFYLINGSKAGTYIYKDGSWNVKVN
jgi:murein DD-endopeptidase MepM/ murein hydrolase activator NlpD